jgi:hypothetical protein
MSEQSKDKTSGDSAFFEGESSGYASAGPEVVTARYAAAHDVCEFLKQLRSSEGWTLSGFKEQKEHDGTWRLYLIMPTETFRVKYGLTPSAPPSQEAPTSQGKIESEISKRIRERIEARLGREQPIIDAEKAFRVYVANLTFKDCDCAVTNYDDRKFLSERVGDDWTLFVNSRGTSRHGSFREAFNIIRQGLLEAPLRDSIRRLEYEHDDGVRDGDGRCDVTCHLKPEHQKKLDELWSEAYEARRAFRYVNPTGQLPPEVRR